MKDALNNYPMALDVAQVAEILNVTPATVRRHIKKHEIPAIKVGSLNTYAHLYPDTQDELADRLDVRFKGKENDG